MYRLSAVTKCLQLQALRGGLWICNNLSYYFSSSCQFNISSDTFIAVAGMPDIVLLPFESSGMVRIWGPVVVALYELGSRWIDDGHISGGNAKVCGCRLTPTS